MRSKIIQELSIELRLIRRYIIRRWQLDTPIRLMGIIVILSGLLLVIIIGNAVAHLYRLFVPIVSGLRVEEVYWSSLGFGIKISLTFAIFVSSLCIFLLLKCFVQK